MLNALARKLPRPARNALRRRMEARALGRLETAVCDTKNLRTDAPSLTASHDWADVASLASVVEDKAGAVNAGDRRAIYTLTQTLQPRHVLEIGTNVGGSTIMFALALREIPDGKLTTVDIVDVNGPDGPAARLNLPVPLQVLRQVHCEGIVEFVVSDSVRFLKNSPSRFDLIFLDGSHDADQVYREIPLALARLNPNGLILLHDFFPNLRPLWSNGNVIPGPWLAVERLRAERVPVMAVPLGALPWPTKLGSNVTSLAYLVRQG